MKEVIRQSPDNSWSPLPSPSFAPLTLVRSLLLVLALSNLISIFSFAQRRPALQPVRRNYFAGRFLLIPRDLRPSSFQQPRMIAEVADHELITPPSRLLGDADKLVAWAKSVDYDETDGVIISLDAIASQSVEGKSREIVGLIEQIRAERPNIPIYGFGSLAGSSGLNSQIAFELVEKGAIDFLAVNGAGKSDEKTDQQSAAKLKAEISARKLQNRIIIDGDQDGATMTLLVRMLNHRFGFVPKILPVYSSSAGRSAIARGSELQIHQMISARISALGGVELAQTSEAARSIDLLLFVHTAQTREQERAALVEAAAQTIEKSVRVAIVDLSETKESKDALFAELRRRKLLDKFAGYATSDPENEMQDDAAARALAQSSSFLVSIKFLRDDLDRVSRIDRAHISLLLSRYLGDWEFALRIRPKLQSFTREPLKAEPDQLDAKNDRAEKFVLDEIKTVAEDLFNDQFKRNIHAYLLSNGNRAQFEVRLLQRLNLRLVLRQPSPHIYDAEIRPSIYLVHLGTEPRLRPQSLTTWQLATERLDERVARRVDSIDWPAFKTDAEFVEVSVKIASQPAAQAGSEESYTIRSKRSRSTRRIEIIAPSHQGAFYALCKLELMGIDGQLAQDFQITEMPAIAQRGIIESNSVSWSHSDRLDMLRFIGSVRMNRYYYAPPGDSSQAESLTEKEVEKLKELVRVSDENFVQFVYAVNASSSSEKEINDLSQKLYKLTTLGVRAFMIRFVDLPEKSQSDADRTSFKSIAASHATLINRIRENLRRAPGNLELSVSPQLPDNSDGVRDYLKDLTASIPQEVQVILGPRQNATNARELAGLINRRPLIRVHLAGNSIDSWRICIDPKRGAPLALIEEADGFLTSPLKPVQTSMLLLATAAEFAWDGSRYDTERAVNRTITLLFDERSRPGVHFWLRSIGDCQSDQNPLVQLITDSGGVDSRLTDQKITELQTALETIGGTRMRGLLRGELSRLIVRARGAPETTKRNTSDVKPPSEDNQ